MSVSLILCLCAITSYLLLHFQLISFPLQLTPISLNFFIIPLSSDSFSPSFHFAVQLLFSLLLHQVFFLLLFHQMWAQMSQKMSKRQTASLLCALMSMLILDQNSYYRSSTHYFSSLSLTMFNHDGIFGHISQ